MSRASWYNFEFITCINYFYLYQLGSSPTDCYLEHLPVEASGA